MYVHCSYVCLAHDKLLFSSAQVLYSMKSQFNLPVAERYGCLVGPNHSLSSHKAIYMYIEHIPTDDKPNVIIHTDRLCALDEM